MAWGAVAMKRTPAIEPVTKTKMNQTDRLEVSSSIDNASEQNERQQIG
jgi:hypothetical protein